MAKKKQLTLKQLAAYDDILTDALVDHVSVLPKRLLFAVRSGGSFAQRMPC